MLIPLTRPAFHYADRRFAAVIKQLFTDPLLTPAGILNLAAQPRGFALVVVSDAFHRIGVAIERHKGVHHRPQAGTVDRQHDFVHCTAVVTHQVDFRLVATAFDTGRIVSRR
ncbi:hypothetical protein D3C78_1312630 [compost metagenome]